MNAARLADVINALRKLPGVGPTRLLAAGYLPPEHQEYLDAARAQLKDAGLEREFAYRGEVDDSGRRGDCPRLGSASMGLAAGAWAERTWSVMTMRPSISMDTLP